MLQALLAKAVGLTQLAVAGFVLAGEQMLPALGLQLAPATWAAVRQKKVGLPGTRGWHSGTAGHAACCAWPVTPLPPLTVCASR